MPFSRPIAQAAAIPINAGRICLVNSSGGQGWVIPKGHIERDQTARETALQEAWEEAGLLGLLKETPIGSYRYKKNGEMYSVKVFLMQVTQIAPTWPEHHRRTRRWIDPDQVEHFVRVTGLLGVFGQLQELDIASVT